MVTLLRDSVRSELLFELSDSNLPALSGEVQSEIISHLVDHFFVCSSDTGTIQMLGAKWLSSKRVR